MTRRLSQALKIFISFDINSFHPAPASASGYLRYNSGKEECPKIGLFVGHFGTLASSSRAAACRAATFRSGIHS